MVKKCTIVANPYLFYGYLIYIGVVFALARICFFLDRTGGYVVLVLWLILVLTACCITDRWCLLITIDHAGLYYRPLFRKGAYISYANYPRVQHAYYIHGNYFLSYKVHFFVLTNRRLNDRELAHINNVSPSPDLLKIRYCKRTYDKIISALPTQLANEVMHIYTTYIK